MPLNERGELIKVAGRIRLMKPVADFPQHAADKHAPTETVSFQDIDNEKRTVFNVAPNKRRLRRTSSVELTMRTIVIFLLLTLIVWSILDSTELARMESKIDEFLKKYLEL